VNPLWGDPLRSGSTQAWMCLQDGCLSAAMSLAHSAVVVPDPALVSADSGSGFAFFSPARLRPAFLGMSDVTDSLLALSAATGGDNASLVETQSGSLARVGAHGKEARLGLKHSKPERLGLGGSGIGAKLKGTAGGWTAAANRSTSMPLLAVASGPCCWVVSLSRLATVSMLPPACPVGDVLDMHWCSDSALLLLTSRGVYEWEIFLDHVIFMDLKSPHKTLSWQEGGHRRSKSNRDAGSDAEEEDAQHSATDRAVDGGGAGGGRLPGVSAVAEVSVSRRVALVSVSGSRNVVSGLAAALFSRSSRALSFVRRVDAKAGATLVDKRTLSRLGGWDYDEASPLLALMAALREQHLSLQEAEWRRLQVALLRNAPLTWQVSLGKVFPRVRRRRRSWLHGGHGGHGRPGFLGLGRGSAESDKAGAAAEDARKPQFQSLLDIAIETNDRALAASVTPHLVRGGHASMPPQFWKRFMVQFPTVMRDEVLPMMAHLSRAERNRSFRARLPHAAHMEVAEEVHQFYALAMAGSAAEFDGDVESMALATGWTAGDTEVGAEDGMDAEGEGEVEGEADGQGDSERLQSSVLLPGTEAEAGDDGYPGTRALSATGDDAEGVQRTSSRRLSVFRSAPGKAGSRSAGQGRRTKAGGDVEGGPGLWRQVPMRTFLMPRVLYAVVVSSVVWMLDLLINKPVSVVSGWFGLLDRGPEGNLFDCVIHEIRMPYFAGHRDHLESSILHQAVAFDHEWLWRSKVLTAVLEFKWATYGRRLFMWNFGQYVILILFFMFDAYMLGLRQSKRLEAEGLDKAEPVIVFFSLLFCTVYSLGEVGQLLIEGRRYLDSLWNRLDMSSLVLYWCTSFVHMLVAVNALEEQTERDLVDVLTPVAAVTALLLWTNILYYARAFESTASLVRTLLQALQDMGAFVLIILIVLAGFSTGFFLLYMQPAFMGSADYEELYLQFGTPLNTVLTLYDMMLGSYDVRVLRLSSSVVLAWLFFLLFSFMMSILLLNVLIAILSDSFERVQERADVEWRRERALLLVEMENLVPQAPDARRLYLSLIGARYPRTLRVLTSVDENLEDRPFIMVGESAASTSGQGQWQGRLRALKDRIERLERSLVDEMEQMKQLLASR